MVTLGRAVPAAERAGCLVRPETFSQVNHHTGAALLAAVTGWLRGEGLGLGLG